MRQQRSYNHGELARWLYRRIVTDPELQGWTCDEIRRPTEIILDLYQTIPVGDFEARRFFQNASVVIKPESLYVVLSTNRHNAYLAPGGRITFGQIESWRYENHFSHDEVIDDFMLSFKTCGIAYFNNTLGTLAVCGACPNQLSCLGEAR